jgi:hypothetical protein
MYYKTKIKYLKQLPTGKVSKVSEEYMVQADSFTEAEANITKVLMDTLGEFHIASCSEVKMESCLFNEEDSENWFKAVVEMITYDDDSGKEKKQQFNHYIQSESIPDALKRVNELYTGSIADWELTAISKTKILEVFDFEEIAAKEKELSEVEA